MERLSANKLGGTGEVYDPHAPITHTKSPIVQGTSVLGIKYKVSQRLTITYFFFYKALLQRKGMWKGASVFQQGGRTQTLARSEIAENSHDISYRENQPLLYRLEH